MSKALENEVEYLRKTVSDQALKFQGIIQDKDIQLQETIAAYEAKIESLLAAQRLAFGKKSERFVDISGDQISLFETDTNQEISETDENDTEDITYTRRKSTNKKQDWSHLPTREVIIRVPEEDRTCSCGSEKQVIGYESKKLLHYVPATIDVEIQKREKLACKKGCADAMRTAPAVPHILPKVQATESLLSYICVSKVLDRQPLYHLEKKIEREHHWRIQRKTMARWMILLADKLQPLINLMKESILDYDVSAIDATTLQVLNEVDRKAETKSQAYCIRGGPPGKEVTLYEYNAYKQRDYVTDFFTEYTGFISADASPVFNGINQQDDITLSYCHAHARRKFENIETMRKKKGNSKKRAKPGLAFYVLKHVYQPLYEIEADMKDRNLSADDVLVYRNEKARPILEAHKKWLDKHHDLTPGGSPIRKALDYSLNHWNGLMAYLDNGRVPIDNNATERDIKPFVIARKNFMFAATPAGADSLAVHFSLIVTAKHHGLDPMAYYTAIFKQIPFCKTFDDYEKLLPWNFKT
jgi:transposase